MAAQPMPPQAGAGAPPPEASEGVDQGDSGGEGGGLSSLIMNVGKGISIVLDQVSKIQEVPDQAKQALAKVLSDYQTVMDAIVNGASSKGGEEPSDQGNVPMEAGGNKGARPMPAGA